MRRYQRERAMVIFDRTDKFLGCENPYATVGGGISAGDLESSIAAAIVDNDVLPFAKCLCEHAVDTFNEITFTVEDRRDNADDRASTHASLATASSRLISL